MRSHVPLCFALLTSLLASTPAFAGDGVIEINGASAESGGVTPGDTPGYPVTLSKSGSYRLTGDLVSSSQAVPVITITTDRVSLDLAGFTVGACLGAGLCATGNASAIAASGVSNLRIHDGVVQGSGGACIFAGGHAVLDDLRVTDCGGNGISAGSYSRVVGVSVSDVDDIGVSLQIGSVLQDSVVSSSGSYGVVVYFNALLVDTVIADNEGAIAASGISGASSGGYRGCVITRNAGAEEVQSISPALLDLGGNICGNDTDCP